MQPSQRPKKSYAHHLMQLVVALGLLLVFAACGVKAPPVAPDAKPPVIASINHHFENGQLTLEWTMAADSSPPESFTLYRTRSPLAEKPCDGCPLLFTVLRSLPAEDPGKGSLTLTLEPGFHYRFKMMATSAGGLTGPDSQTIIFEY